MKFKPVSFILFACLITVGCDQTPLVIPDLGFSFHKS
jgi:hypothetical protein